MQNSEKQTQIEKILDRIAELEDDIEILRYEIENFSEKENNWEKKVIKK